MQELLHQLQLARIIGRHICVVLAPKQDLLWATQRLSGGGLASVGATWVLQESKLWSASHALSFSRDAWSS